jgi:hypothetical protein
MFSSVINIVTLKRERSTGFFESGSDPDLYEDGFAFNLHPGSISALEAHLGAAPSSLTLDARRLTLMPWSLTLQP